MKAKESGSLPTLADLDSDTRSFRNRENGRAVSEKLQQWQGKTLCRKTLIPWPVANTLAIRMWLSMIFLSNES
jgi:hypothetical protein